jgi:hypothetical protein
VGNLAVSRVGETSTSGFVPCGVIESSADGYVLLATLPQIAHDRVPNDIRDGPNRREDDGVLLIGWHGKAFSGDID